MAPLNRTKCKTKGGMAAATKPNNPATVNPAAANNTAVATASASKCSCLEHGRPANATTSNATEPNPPAAVAVQSLPPLTMPMFHPGGGLATTVSGSDSVEYDNSTSLCWCCRHDQWPRRHRPCLSTCWRAK
jgi:hypothetical protein